MPEPSAAATHDGHLMRRAVELAARGEGAVEPNPMVGCVVARDGQILGEGWHQRYGGHHAEVNALAAAGDTARGATLYVTLEPCCHTGKTPPCSRAVVASGVARVVIAAGDPNPVVDGGGAAELRAAGIDVVMGVGEAEALQQQAPYRKLLATGRPWVIAKWAMTLDGRIAARDGTSQWISSPESRAVVHQLRGRVDAVLVGRGTAAADDPLLTARPPGPRTATRVVLGAVAQGSQLAETIDQAPLLVFARDASEAGGLGWLADRGAEVLVANGSTRAERFDAVLRELGRRRMTNVLVEGGAAVLGAALDAGQLDEAHAFIAPKLIGGEQATAVIGGQGLAPMAAALRFDSVETSTVGGDLYFLGRARRDA